MTYLEKISKQGYYIIAEIGVNYYEISEKEHISLLDAAKMMITAAAENGADAVKFQTYMADRFVSPLYAKDMYEAVQKYERFGESEYKELSAFSVQKGVDFFSTPFDTISVDYLSPLTGMFKIASADITNIPLIEEISQRDKPILLSVGAAEKAEIDQAIAIITKYNTHTITLLHCVLEYPTPYEDANLERIRTLKKLYPHAIIGYSDHTIADQTMQVLLSAYITGAQVIEKHFTLDKTILENDHSHSMDARDLRTLKEKLGFVSKLMGCGDIGCLEHEKTVQEVARRAAYAAEDIFKGDILTEDMIVMKRPYKNGLSYTDVVSLFGKAANRDVLQDEQLHHIDFS